MSKPPSERLQASKAALLQVLVDIDNDYYGHYMGCYTTACRAHLQDMDSAFVDIVLELQAENRTLKREAQHEQAAE